MELELNKKLKDFDLILISSGKFIDTVFSQTQVDISSFDDVRFRQEIICLFYTTILNCF